jgi:hypothetical protein
VTERSPSQVSFRHTDSLRAEGAAQFGDPESAYSGWTIHARHGAVRLALNVLRSSG